MDRVNKKKTLMTAALFAVLFAIGITAAYVVFESTSPPGRPPLVEPAGEISTTIQLFFPSGGKLQSEERSVPRTLSRLSAARATVEEFLKGPSGDIKSYVPGDAELLNIYDGSDGILYVDLSEAFVRNFQGDAFVEFLLLRGLYESILTNVYGVADVKVLIAGREAETLGGHISILKPLGESVSQTLVEE